ADLVRQDFVKDDERSRGADPILTETGPRVYHAVRARIRQRHRAMRFMSVRFTIQWMMVLVAVLAMVLALLRVHPSLAALAAGVFSMALIRTYKKIDRAHSAGRSMRSLEVVETCLDSMVVAFSILGGALLPAIGIMLTFSRSLWHRPLFDEKVIMFIMFSALLGISIADHLRHKMW